MPRKGTTKYQSSLQENRVAKEVSGKTVIASGALWGSKGDVRSDLFLIECKTTVNPFYTIHFETWDKIEKEAIKDGLRIPVMEVDLVNGARRLAVMREADFIALYHYKFNPTSSKDATKQTTVAREGTRIVFTKSNTILVTILWDTFIEVCKSIVSISFQDCEVAK